ncbi:hypothetical protein BO94DRAFT_339597 [Aspergillus sclerotioniger CBS 115572]|uniref:Uncharacterized protein n=1 Tax=Aspergillus sclerotioniger CBS 115572 TaxID=1450535 RepID=A0A317UVA5_9EURO|nr:hypothetical protein BO94DRAFT_339597 [Aspergillus sclerotioniger CBS 115572]PWY65381.1 hypothetical protein BO94DRAFT_339597 [Aspergillus sclerotioniger CBS 115572]
MLGRCDWGRRGDGRCWMRLSKAIIGRPCGVTLLHTYLVAGRSHAVAANGPSRPRARLHPIDGHGLVLHGSPSTTQKV